VPLGIRAHVGEANSLRWRFWRLPELALFSLARAWSGGCFAREGSQYDCLPERRDRDADGGQQYVEGGISLERRDNADRNADRDRPKRSARKEPACGAQCGFDIALSMPREARGRPVETRRSPQAYRRPLKRPAAWTIYARNTATPASELQSRQSLLPRPSIASVWVYCPASASRQWAGRVQAFEPYAPSS
jgi:hypothetical protein